MIARFVQQIALCLLRMWELGSKKDALLQQQSSFESMDGVEYESFVLIQKIVVQTERATQPQKCI